MNQGKQVWQGGDTEYPPISMFAGVVDGGDGNGGGGVAVGTGVAGMVCSGICRDEGVFGG